MTKETRDLEIVARLDADPTLSMRDIAPDYGLTIGRVSQIWRKAHPGEEQRHYTPADERQLDAALAFAKKADPRGFARVLRQIAELLEDKALIQDEIREAREDADALVHTDPARAAEIRAGADAMAEQEATNV